MTKNTTDSAKNSTMKSSVNASNKIASDTTKNSNNKPSDKNTKNTLPNKDKAKSDDKKKVPLNKVMVST